MFIKTKSEFETSWDSIKNAVDGGGVTALLHSGDEIPVTLKNGENVIFVVTYDENGKIYFVLRDCLADEHRMNKEWTNEGGWAATEMRTYLNSTIFALLPDDLQAVIAPTKIVQILDVLHSY